MSNIPLLLPITNYPKYFITRDGDVYSIFKGGLTKLRPQYDSSGYLQIRLFSESKKGKSFKVHRLVAEAILGAAANKNMQVDHINGVKDDNRVENLRWLTQQANLLKKYNEDGHKTHFAKPVRQISLENGTTLNRWPSGLDAAKATQSDCSAISKVCRGLMRQTNGFKWEYV